MEALVIGFVNSRIEKGVGTHFVGLRETSSDAQKSLAKFGLGVRVTWIDFRIPPMHNAREVKPLLRTFTNTKVYKRGRPVLLMRWLNSQARKDGYRRRVCPSWRENVGQSRSSRLNRLQMQSSRPVKCDAVATPTQWTMPLGAEKQAFLHETTNRKSWRHSLLQLFRVSVALLGKFRFAKRFVKTPERFVRRRLKTPLADEDRLHQVGLGRIGIAL